MVVCWLLATLADALVLDEEPECSAVVWRVSEYLRQRRGCRIALASRKNQLRTVVLLIEQLGQARFDELCAQGASLSINQMLRYAQAGLPDSGAGQMPRTKPCSSTSEVCRFTLANMRPRRTGLRGWGCQPRQWLNAASAILPGMLPSSAISARRSIGKSLPLISGCRLGMPSHSAPTSQRWRNATQRR
jgi:hypothetical protein